MTCNVPRNIIRQQTNKCNLKCKLWYKYGNSSCLVKNNKDHLEISYDGENDVMFNMVPYTPTQILIFKPSIHTYDGQYAAAELVICHKGGINGLYICVPIIVSQTMSSSAGSTILEDIFKNAPTDVQPITLNIQDYNANYLIPKSSYFSYVGNTIPINGNCLENTNAQYVAFHQRHGNMTITQNALDNLGKLIHDSYIPVYDGKSFFNETGTKSNGFAGDGEIFMDCQPVGEDSEIVYQESTNTKPQNLDWVYSVIYVICGILLAILLSRLFEFFISSIGNKKPITEQVNLK
jgi:carbonic anhydrase